jgi:hypothetical protein
MTEARWLKHLNNIHNIRILGSYSRGERRHY